MSKWKRERGDCRDCWWVAKQTHVGELAVEHCPWLGEKGKPFLVTWWPACARSSDPVRIGCATTEALGKRMAANYLRRLAAMFADYAEAK